MASSGSMLILCWFSLFFFLPSYSLCFNRFAPQCFISKADDMNMKAVNWKVLHLESGCQSDRMGDILVKWSGNITTCWNTASNMSFFFFFFLFLMFRGLPLSQVPSLYFMWAPSQGTLWPPEESIMTLPLRSSMLKHIPPGVFFLDLKVHHSFVGTVKLLS